MEPSTILGGQEDRMTGGQERRRTGGCLSPSCPPVILSFYHSASAPAARLLALAQLHIPIHRRQPNPPSALAQRGAKVSRVDAASDRHRPVRLEAPVHRGQIDVGVDV